jgi:hypothetical protein
MPSIFMRVNLKKPKLKQGYMHHHRDRAGEGGEGERGKQYRTSGNTYSTSDIKYYYPCSSVKWYQARQEEDVAGGGQFCAGLAVETGNGGSTTAFFSALSRNTAYECAACASSAAAARNFSMTFLHTLITRSRCSAVNVGAMCGLRS